MKKNRNESLEEAMKLLEKGVSEIFESENYQRFLDTMSKFYKYSYGNSILIMLQRPDATCVASYTSWKKNFKRQVKKSAKGIRILAPCIYKKKNDDGDDEEETEYLSFRVCSVFDISDTEGQDLPTFEVKELIGSVDGFERFWKAAEEASPVPVLIDDVIGGAKGFFSPADQKIVVKRDMEEIQSVKTLIHEICHAMIHDPKNIRLIDQSKVDRQTKEVEAESVAYVVCRHFEIDTAPYSFGYVTGWSNGRELNELKSSLQIIRDASMYLIETIENNLKGRFEYDPAV